MITTGIVRRFDDLGRIHIPKEVRKNAYGTWKVEGNPVEIFCEQDGTIILKPYKEEKYESA